MITRRTVVLAAAVAPLLSVVPAIADEAHSDKNGRVDGEVEMTFSSQLRRQKLTFGESAWTETRDRVAVDEGQRVRLVLVNDTSDAETVRFTGDIFGEAQTLSVPAGARAHIDFEASNVGEGVIAASNMAQVVRVRPSYFPHPMV